MRLRGRLMKQRIGATLAAVVFLGAWWTLSRPASPSPSTRPAATSAAATPVKASNPVVAAPPSTAKPTAKPTGEVDRRDAIAVAAAFAVTLETWDTAHDDSPLDASRRAAVYATPGLARRLRLQPPPPPQAWATLAARHATTSVSTIVGGLGPQPPDGATSAIRAITCVITDRADGWRAEGGDVAVIAHLHRSRPGRPWAVQSFQLTIV